ncbi:MAG: 2-phospho-L-lactate transferase [Actinomycetota bacterium]|nr:2-phospho-L-lactate transferase [Actinomycetota bacterium]
MTADVAVICGGVGAARMLAALSAVTDPNGIVGVVNTGDDDVINGLEISPDLDTITYTLAGAIDPGRGWGLANESWRAMGALHRYADVRPDGSQAADTWFSLGDRDLATHLYRTARRREGASLSTVADEIRRAWDVTVRLLPMTDERLATRLQLEDGRWVSFQDYFVGLRHAVPVLAVDFTGRAATLTADAAIALGTAARVVIAPSNPIVSIGPIRSLPGTDQLLAARRESVVAVSPIVGGVALKGPADRLLAELGHAPSVVGVATLYAPIAGALVIDPVDAALAGDVEAAGLRCVVTPSVMSSPEASARLAAAVLDAVPAYRLH